MSERSKSHGRARALRERQRFVEQGDRRGDARELVPAHRQPVEDVGTFDVGEVRALRELARADEELDRVLDVAHLLQ